jgi:AraC-like DNA-binding protein
LHKTLRPLRVTAAGPYEAPAGRHFPPHQHDVWELVYYRAGCIQCPVGDDVYLGQPGTFLLTPPRTVHAEYASTAYSNYFILIDAPIGNQWPKMIQDDSDQTFGRLCTAIVREQNDIILGREQMLAALLIQLDILLRRSCEQHTPSEKIVRQAEKYIQEHYSSNITITAISRELNVSTSYLRVLFMRLRGYTPMTYLQTVRTRMAVVILQSTTLTLDRVADLCGYDSASHLSRSVRRATGKTPGALRNGDG